VGLSQTSIIFFYMLAAFVIFITVRGELPQYTAVFFGNPTNTC
jgi:hypothetical protein